MDLGPEGCLGGKTGWKEGDRGTERDLGGGPQETGETLSLYSVGGHPSPNHKKDQMRSLPRVAQTFSGRRTLAGQNSVRRSPQDAVPKHKMGVG